LHKDSDDEEEVQESMSADLSAFVVGSEAAAEVATAVASGLESWHQQEHTETGNGYRGEGKLQFCTLSLQGGRKFQKKTPKPGFYPLGYDCFSDKISDNGL